MESSRSLDLMDVVNPIVKENHNFIEVVPDSKHLYQIRDLSPNKYYFFIHQRMRRSPHWGYRVTYLPKSESNNASVTDWVNESRLKEVLENWIRLTKKYNQATGHGPTLTQEIILDEMDENLGTEQKIKTIKFGWWSWLNFKIAFQSSDSFWQRVQRIQWIIGIFSGCCGGAYAFIKLIQLYVSWRNGISNP
jgi:hypothetical protein